MPPYFPEALKSFPAQAQVTWLFFRDHPDSLGSGVLLQRELGGNQKSYLSHLRLLRRAGLLVPTGQEARTYRYRVCTQAEAQNALPYDQHSTSH